MKPPVIYLFVQHTCPEFPESSPIACISATFSNIDVVYKLADNTYVLGDALAIAALQTKVTRGRLSLIRIEDHKEQICRFSRSVDSFEYSAWRQRVPTAGLCPKILFRIVTRSLGCFCRARVAALEGSQRWQNLLLSAPAHCHCMLGILSNTSPSQHTAQHAHKITKAATLIEHLRKRPYREAWGTCTEPWGFAGSLGCLQGRSYAPTNLMHFCHVPISQHAVTLWPILLKNLVGKESSDQWQEKPLASSFAAYLHELSRWPQHYENDSTAWSFQTLAFAMIWNCWKRAPLFKCSDTVCRSSIKTSKIPGTSETCTTCMSLRGIPRPWS